MSSLVSDEARRLVAERADFLCEYCLLHQDERVLERRALIAAGRYPSIAALARLRL